MFDGQELGNERAVSEYNIKAAPTLRLLLKKKKKKVKRMEGEGLRTLINAAEKGEVHHWSACWKVRDALDNAANESDLPKLRVLINCLKRGVH
jgi:hypothetical protein